MNFLKKLFGSGGGSPVHREGNSAYYYLKLDRCGEVMRVRVDMNNDLSLNDESSGYWVRKMITSSNYKCPKAEITLYFDTNRRLDKSEIQGGHLVSREEYDAWMAAQQPS